MKVWFSVLDAHRNVNGKGIIEGNARQVLKCMMNVWLAGQVELVQPLKDLFEEHGLDDMTPDELLTWLVGADDDVFDTLAMDFDQDVITIREQTLFLLNGQVGTEMFLENDDGTWIFVKLN